MFIYLLETLKTFENSIKYYLPLHWNGTELLQARGREIPRFAFKNGIETGTFPVIIRHAQSMLSVMRDFNESQQSRVGDEPEPVLPVMKFKQGVKLLIIEVEHAVLICAFVLKIVQDIIRAINVIVVALIHE